MSLFADIASEMIDRQRLAESQAVPFRAGGLSTMAANSMYHLLAIEIRGELEMTLAQIYESDDCDEQMAKLQKQLQTVHKRFRDEQL